MKDKRKNRAKSVRRAVAIGVMIVALASMGLEIGASASREHLARLALGVQSAAKEDAKAPRLSEDGHWTFVADGDFTVLQLSDTHINGGALAGKRDASALSAIAALVRESSPDLVIVTGDIIYPMPFFGGGLNNLAAARIFAELMNGLGVFWTVTFGNHDSENFSYYSRGDLSGFFSGAEVNYSLNPDARCLYQAGSPDADGFGNHVINIESSSGLITQSLFMLDSHAYAGASLLGLSSKYANITQAQTDWYASQLALFTERNGALSAGTPRSLAFFHIPLREYRDAYDEHLQSGGDTENVRWVYGAAGEGGKIVYHGAGDDRLFETMHSLGSTQGIFVGHDHLNNFSVEYRGIRLTYGMSIDYIAYFGIHKKTAQRGGTVVTVRADGSFDCFGLRLNGLQRVE